MRRFRRLPRKQFEVFEQIAVNNDLGHHPQTLAALERKGLIESWDEIQRYDGFPHRLTVKRYGVPVSIHAEWCEWCSGEGKK